ncbi:MAG TPA: hypothetical protein VFW71_11030 [Actinomycetota bacterium]|nr:hypothetical protein [Actinomycetota bacterium]
MTGRGGRVRAGRPAGGALVVALGMAVGFLLVACSTSHPKGSAGPAMSLSVSTGKVTVNGGGRSTTVTTRAGVAVGYRIQVAAGGLATLNLSPGRVFQIQSGEADITAPGTVELVSGSALGQFTAPGEIDAQGVATTASNATFRVDSGATTTVASYAGTVTVTIPGSSMPVPAYDRVQVVGGVLPANPVPLQYTNAGDVWDHDFVQPALDLDGRLASFRNGLDAQLGNASGAAFFRLAVPDPVALAAIAPFYGDPRSDVLIGWVIAKHAPVPADKVAPTFAVVMTLWSQGQPWGLIAMEFQVPADTVFAGLEDAIHQVGISVSNPIPKLTAPPITIPTGRPTPSPTTPAVSPTPPVVAPTPTQTPGGLGTLLNPVVDTVNTLLNNLLHLLLPGPSPSP